LVMPGGSDFVGKVRSSVDLVSLIAESVPLKKAGRKYRGLCPFHNEKTPSFYVDETKQLFYCFGCGAGGDTFKFVMMREGVEFLEAARLLARRSNIPLPETRSGPRGSEREALLAACRAAATLYREILLHGPEGDVGRNYLEKRGVNGATRELLALGFAPDRWDTLRDALQKQGHRPEVLMAAGLLQRREDGSGHYDRFRNRIIFPISSLSGDVIGFGGRIVGDGEPKYLNSPETIIYNKRENLYGLSNARQGIKEAGEAIVVEGYLDCASLVQAGVRNVVATLGTSFTDEQASLLRRFAEKVLVNYDTDNAGESAARRSLEKLLARGFTVRVLRLPSGKDPDAFLRASTPDEYRKLAAAAPSCFDFLVDSVSRERDLGDPGALASAAREILPILAQVPSRLERSRYVGLLSEKMKVEDALLLAEIRDVMLRGARETSQAPIATGPARSPVSLKEVEMTLVRALLEDESVRARLLAEILPADLEGSPVAAIVSRISAMQRQGGEVTYAELASALPDGDRELLARIALRGDPPAGEGEAVHCLETLRRSRLIRERETLQKEMERTSEPVRLDELLRRKIELSRRIDTMS
jgi:DNA primase